MAIRQRGKKWQVDVNIPPHKRVRAAADTENNAKILEAKIVATIRSGGEWVGEVGAGDAPGKPPKGTLQEALDGVWAERWKGTGRSGEGQYRNAKLIVDLFGPTFACRNITDAHMLEAQQVMRGAQPARDGKMWKPRSEVRINRIMQAFSMIFRYAKKAGWVTHRPEWERNAKADKKRRMWTCSEAQEAQLITYFEATGSLDMADLVQLYIDTGARNHELTYCEAEGYKPAPGAVPGTGRLELYETKGDVPRAVPLTRRAEAIIQRRVAKTPAGRLFKGWYPDKVSKKFAEALDLLGIVHPDACVHGLRHTFGTRAAERGMNPIALKDIMGHSRLETTMGYVKMSSVALRKAMDGMEREAA